MNDTGEEINIYGKCSEKSLIISYNANIQKKFVKNKYFDYFF